MEDLGKPVRCLTGGSRTYRTGSELLHERGSVFPLVPDLFQRPGYSASLAYIKPLQNNPGAGRDYWEKLVGGRGQQCCGDDYDGGSELD
jgi:hypothetical protein